MGLEIVELLIELEECFQTRIPDSEAEKICTLGELQQFFIQRIEQQESSTCISASIFYSIRQLLQSKYNLRRQDIQLNSLLEEMIPLQERHDFWQALEKKLRIDLPSLRRASLLNWNKYRFPESIITIENLIYKCERSCSISNKFDSRNEQVVWLNICQIVAKWADVNIEDLNPETDIIRDLSF